MGINESFELKHSIVIFAVLFVVSLILKYFNLTSGFDMYDLIKIDLLIALLIGCYFKNRQWFKTVSLIFILLILLMFLVDFLERNLYFGLGSPNVLRFIIIVGGSSAIVIGILAFFALKMREI